MAPPSCCGLPSVFSAEAKTCSVCKDRSLCVSACHGMLMSLSSKMDVTTNIAYLERTAKVVTAQSTPASPVATTIAAPAVASIKVNLTLGEREQSTLAALPAHAAKVLRPMMARGADSRARYRVAQGQNPFDETAQRWLRLAGEMLIAGGFTKAQLRQAFVTEFGWSEGTAFARVSIVVAIFPALRIATLVGDRLVCMPSAVGKTAV
ncbi:hypothetical protein BVI1335_70149 [Burkholderia vietnamiensis]|nr:hypothetical protein BVI1335_70149 [Burkholderia vietnamiensis]